MPIRLAGTLMASVYRLDGLAYKIVKRKEDFDNELRVLRAVRNTRLVTPTLWNWWTGLTIVSFHALCWWHPVFAHGQ